MPKNWSIQHGDCLPILSKLPSSLGAGAFITDPSYCSVGSASQASSKRYYSGKQEAPDYDGESKDYKSFAFWLTLVLIEARRVTRVGGMLCMFADWRGLSVVPDIMQAAGWTWRGVAVWNKGRGTRPRKGGCRAQCEFIVWASNGPMGHGSGVVLDGCFDERRLASDRSWHQMAKPVAVCEQLAQMAEPGELIVDPFCGGASVGVGALRQGRRYLGMDSSILCVQRARERMKLEAS